MRVIVVLVILLNLTTNDLFSQRSGLGIKIGVNISGVYSESMNNRMLLLGHAGSFYNIPVRESFYFSPGVELSFQGFELKETSTLGTNEKIKTILGYCNVPLILKANVFERFTLEGGIEVGILVVGFINSRTYYDGTDVKSRFKKFSVGVGSGVRYNFWNDFNIGMRFQFGLTDINNSFLVNGSEIYNRTIQVSIGKSIGNQKD